MRRRTLLIAAGMVLLFIVGIVALRQNEYHRESYGGKHTRDWALQLLSSQTTSVDSNRNEAIAALRALGPRAIPPLRRMLAERDKIYDKAVVEAARSLPFNQRQMVIQGLRPGQALAHRLAAIRALGEIGTNGLSAVPDLRRAMQEPIGQIRWDAARTLMVMGDAGLVALASAASDTNAGVRHAAIYALGESHTNSPLVATTLFNALFDPDNHVRASATYAVGQMEQSAVPVLIERLNSTDPETQVAAMRALGGVRPPLQLVGTLLTTIATNSTGELRRQTIETMGVLRLSSSNAANVIISALDDTEPAIRLAAIKSVGEISWKTTAAIPRLTELTGSVIPGERAAAASALGQFGASASNAAPSINLLLMDAEAVVRTAATNALARIIAPLP